MVGSPDYSNRRQFLIGAGFGAAGAAAALAASPVAAFAAGEDGDEAIEGCWHVSIHVTSPNAPPPIDFDALYAFARGGVFTRIDGRTNGSSLGTWKRGGDGIVFSNLQFNFPAGVVPTFGNRNGAIVGKFAARVVDGTLTGTFTADGIPPLTFHRDGTFTGSRIDAVGP